MTEELSPHPKGEEAEGMVPFLFRGPLETRSVFLVMGQLPLLC